MGNEQPPSRKRYCFRTPFLLEVNVVRRCSTHRGKKWPTANIDLMGGRGGGRYIKSIPFFAGGVPDFCCFFDSYCCTQRTNNHPHPQEKIRIRKKNIMRGYRYSSGFFSRPGRSSLQIFGREQSIPSSYQPVSRGTCASLHCTHWLGRAPGL